MLGLCDFHLLVEVEYLDLFKIYTDSTAGVRTRRLA